MKTRIWNFFYALILFMMGVGCTPVKSGKKHSVKQDAHQVEESQMLAEQKDSSMEKSVSSSVKANSEMMTEDVSTQKSNRKAYRSYISKLRGDSDLGKREKLFAALHSKFPEYWQGTTWDFNGMSTDPGNGQIACGYYVSTTLRDLGFPVKRIWLAQQAAATVVEQVCVGEKRFTSQQGLYDFVNAQPDSTVYIVGLDFHVGYLTKARTNEIYFIHSNYIDNEGPIKELAKESMAFANSNLYVLGNLSDNDSLLAQWDFMP